MPSRAELFAGRARLERVLRVGALLLAVMALVRLWRATDENDSRVHQLLVATPSPAERDALAARARAGQSVTWGGALADIATAAEPAREPGDRWRLMTVSAAPTVVRDELGPLDSLAEGGGTLTTRTPRGAWSVASGTSIAGADPAARPELGRVLVLARAGWEAKFVIAALEEEGWGVDARLALGRQNVTQGDARLRLERHAAVVVLDSPAVSNAEQIVRFVRAGGGLVLSGEGASLRTSALRQIAPSARTRVEPPETREVIGHEPTHALPLYVALDVRADALVLETRDGLNAVAARRERAGRVLQSGYSETWRWRMQGEEEAVAAHRLWWSRLVGTVAYASPVLTAPHSSSHVANAPLAELVQALGPSVDSPATPVTPRAPLPAWLGIALLVLLLGEWASRRARGAA